jgi:hypothetical protein
MSTIEFTEEQLNKLMRTAIESAMKEKENGKTNNKITIPKFSGKENEKFEDYLFQLEIWMETTNGNDKSKSAMIISGLSGNALDTIKNIPKENILKKHGPKIIIDELKKRYGKA